MLGNPNSPRIYSKIGGCEEDEICQDIRVQDTKDLQESITCISRPVAPIQLGPHQQSGVITRSNSGSSSAQQEKIAVTLSESISGATVTALLEGMY
jgi:hypothetical protein